MHPRWSGELRVASLATVPSRVDCLRTALASLRPQVSTINVYLNGHTEVPACVTDFECNYALSSEHGDLGDAGKFFWAADLRSAWHVTCDDDFWYAANHVDHLVDAARRLSAAVSLHGVELSDELAQGHAVDWLKEGRRRWLRACDSVPEDVRVHVLGTGVGCYHTDLVRVSIADFPLPHSADIWFSSICQAQGVARFVPVHPGVLAKQTAPPLVRGPRELRWSGEYSKRVARCAPWTLGDVDD